MYCLKPPALPVCSDTCHFFEVLNFKNTIMWPNKLEKEV